MRLSPSVLRFNILCGLNVFTVWVRSYETEQRDSTCVLSVYICIHYLCESAFISICCIYDIYLAAWKIHFIDCTCECAIKLSGAWSPIAWASASVWVCHSGESDHLWDVWLLKHSWASFNFNCLGYFVLCLREWEANTTEGDAISSREKTINT